MRRVILFLIFMFFVYGFLGCNATTTLENPTTTLESQTTTYTTQSTTITTEKQLTVTFNSMGGQEVDSLSVDKGSTIQIPEVSKEGYTLEGWYTSINNGVTYDEKWSFLSNVVNNDITLYAKWTINQYTITFEANEGPAVESITQDYNTPVQEPTVLTEEGYTFNGWYLDSALTTPYTFSTMPAENITIYAKWDINQYSITFESNGGSAVEEITQNYGSLVLEPQSPMKTGYVFAGWYLDSGLTTFYIFDTISDEDITLYAKWELIYYTITYELDGGINIGNQSNYTIETETIILNESIKDGYTFSGWYDNLEFDNDPITEITSGSTGNIVLYAKWTVNQYSIYYEIINNIPLNTGESIIKISLGDSHSAVLTSIGKVYIWGRNSDRQLGDGTTVNKNTPIDITSQFNLNVGEKITDIALGWLNSSALTSDGRIFVWGYNEYGQIGDGTIDTIYFPKDITSQFNLNIGETITQVSLGWMHSSLITSEGRIFVWGRNNHGQLGDGTYVDSLVPKDITSQFGLAVGEGVTEVSLGYYSSSALTSSGRMFTWGYNYYGQLGNGMMTQKNTPQDITSQFGLNTGEKIVGISMGDSHTSAITSESRMFTWGRNNYGQLGDDTLDQLSPMDITSEFSLNLSETFTQLSLGRYHSSVLTSEGRYFIWGYNNSGQLADGTNIEKKTPIEITSQFNLNQGDIISKVSLGGYHSSLLTSDGEIFLWGYNTYGQLGDATYASRYLPVQTVYDFTLLLEDIFDYDSSIIEYEPILEGYTFSGWYIDIEMTTLYDFIKMPCFDILLYGKWVKNT